MLRMKHGNQSYTLDAQNDLSVEAIGSFRVTDEDGRVVRGSEVATLRAAQDTLSLFKNDPTFSAPVEIAGDLVAELDTRIRSSLEIIGSNVFTGAVTIAAGTVKSVAMGAVEGLAYSVYAGPYAPLVATVTIPAGAKAGAISALQDAVFTTIPETAVEARSEAFRSLLMSVAKDFAVEAQTRFQFIADSAPTLLRVDSNGAYDVNNLRTLSLEWHRAAAAFNIAANIPIKSGLDNGVAGTLLQNLVETMSGTPLDTLVSASRSSQLSDVYNLLAGFENTVNFIGTVETWVDTEAAFQRIDDWIVDQWTGVRVDPFSVHGLAEAQQAYFASSDVGSEADDRLVAKFDNDLVSGHGGADELWAEGSGIFLFGGSGNDTLHGGPNDDFLDGEEGADTYVIAQPQGQDIIADEHDENTIVVFSAVGLSEFDSFQIGKSGKDISISGVGGTVWIRNAFLNDAPGDIQLASIILKGNGWSLQIEDVIGRIPPSAFDSPPAPVSWPTASSEFYDGNSTYRRGTEFLEATDQHDRIREPGEVVDLEDLVVVGKASAFMEASGPYSDRMDLVTVHVEGGQLLRRGREIDWDEIHHQWDWEGYQGIHVSWGEVLSEEIGDYQIRMPADGMTVRVTLEVSDYDPLEQSESYQYKLFQQLEFTLETTPQNSAPSFSVQDLAVRTDEPAKPIITSSDPDGDAVTYDIRLVDAPPHASIYILGQHLTASSNIEVSAELFEHSGSVRVHGANAGDTFTLSVTPLDYETAGQTKQFEVSVTNSPPQVNDDHFVLDWSADLIIDTSALLANDVDLNPGDPAVITDVRPIQGGYAFRSGTDLVVHPTGTARDLFVFNYDVYDGLDHGTGTVTIAWANSESEADAPESPETGSGSGGGGSGGGSSSSGGGSSDGGGRGGSGGSSSSSGGGSSDGGGGTTVTPTTTTTTTFTPVVGPSASSIVSGGGGAPVTVVSNVIADLPTGVSIISQGPTGAQSASGAASAISSNLSAMANPDDQVGINKAMSAFVANQGTNVQVSVSTITPTLSPGTSNSGPITINGNVTNVESLLIDTRSLPAGSLLELHDVDFAVIVGNTTVTGGSGSNFVIGDGHAQLISLGADDDTLSGGAGSDFVGSAGGDDILFGNAGNDTVVGGEGIDQLYGNLESDLLYGNLDTDFIYGGQGIDTAYGGQGADLVYGNLAGDLLYGNLSEDTVYGGQGDDVIYGGQGDDVIYGNRGNDIIHGNLGADTMHGGAGNDVLHAGNPEGGTNEMNGGDGNDTFFGSNGIDYYFTGTGVDRIMIAELNIVDVIADFDGASGDVMLIQANANGNGIDSFAELLAAASDVDGYVNFDLGGGNSVRLIGCTTESLEEGWFSFY